VLVVLALVTGSGVAGVVVGTVVVTRRGVIPPAGVRVPAIALALIGLAGVVPARIRGRGVIPVRSGLGVTVPLLAIAPVRIALRGVLLVSVTPIAGPRIGIAPVPVALPVAVG